MGAATDLQNEGLRRLVVNAVYWGLGLDVPAKANVAVVGEFKPTMYGFNGYRKGVKLADHALKAPAVPAISPQPAVKAGPEPPTEWVEPATGHRVIRLSRDAGTSSLYFHQNAFTADGDKLVVTTRDGLATISLKTRAVEPIVEGRAGNVVVGKKTRQVFYTKAGTVYATHLDTKATREIAQLPPEMRGAGFALNADETLLAGSYVEGGGQRSAPPADGTPPPAGRRAGGRDASLEARWAARRPMRLYTVSIATGEVKTFHPCTDWLNHVQFSPTDPTLLMFCHEGPWHKLDRIWTIRTDGTGLKLMHPRTVPNEIAGHEFFGPDGKMIWYDLQTPRSQQFWLAGVNVATGERLRYPVERSQWSVHYNVSPDGKLFAGDGGGPASVANRTPLPDNQPLDPPGNGQWIYLFRPQPGAGETIQAGTETVKVGRLAAEKLVHLSKHDYRLEPNVKFTPDGKWIVFQSNMHGAPHVYAVEVAKADAAARPTLFIVGDSTVKTGTRGQQGWGDPIAKLFDPARIKVENHAIGGRSSRTFQTEGRWDKILAAAKPGDFVLIQMGHNDGGPLDDKARARGSIRGTGEETREIDNPITGKHEVVHTYGWYLRKYIADAKAKEMTPIICSPIPHCPREPVQPGDVEKSNYVFWSEEVAKSQNVPFIHLNRITMGHYATLSPADIKAKYFTPADNTHTSPAGAERNALSVVEGLRELTDCPLASYLLDKQAAP
jgi:oligogalacturonide lyase